MNVLSRSKASPGLPESVQRPRLGRLRALTVVSALAATGVATAVPAMAVPAPSPTSTPSVSVASPTPSKASVAAWGAGWLADQITANGGYLKGFGGTPDLTDTAYAVVSLQAAGVGKASTDNALQWLVSQVPTLRNADNTDDPGRLSYLILAGVSAGRDVRHFGGNTPANNLVARLLATSRTTGTDKGLFGASDPAYDGATRQGLALAALKAAEVPVGTAKVAAGIGWLGRQQCVSGLWVSYRASTATACPAVDFDTFSGPDTNSTAVAVEGLAAYGKHPRRGAVLTALASVQSADGGFPYLAAAGQSSDPNSTALSIQAILAEGGQPTATRWHSGHQGPFAALAGYQLGCSAPAADRGAFFYPGSKDANVLASVQAVLAETGRTLPVAKTSATAAIPHPSCPGPAGTTPANATPAGTTPAGAAAAPVSAAAVARRSATTAGHAGHCTGGVGVTVAVDFTGFAGGVQVRCAPGTPATGIAALQQAGFTVAGTTQYGIAFVCRINNKPAPIKQKCLTTPPANAYWAYYQAAKGATSWKYAGQGPLGTHPAQGSIEGWSFGAGAKMHKTPAQVRQL